MPQCNWTNKVFFGRRKSDKAMIYLSAPSWECGRYWGFGYLGNYREHYHLSGYQNRQVLLKNAEGNQTDVIREQRNKNMYDCLLEDYELNPKIKDNLWLFCELVMTAYALKETAEVLGRGGAHYTENPAKDTIKNPDEVKRINEVVLPEIFNKLNELLNS